MLLDSPQVVEITAYSPWVLWVTNEVVLQRPRATIPWSGMLPSALVRSDPVVVG